MGRATFAMRGVKSQEAVEYLHREGMTEGGPGVAGMMVGLVWMPAEGQAWATMECYLLPHCEPGQAPRHFETFDALLDYLEGTFTSWLAFARGEPGA